MNEPENSIAEIGTAELLLSNRVFKYVMYGSITFLLFIGAVTPIVLFASGVVSFVDVGMAGKLSEQAPWLHLAWLIALGCCIEAAVMKSSFLHRAVSGKQKLYIGAIFAGTIVSMVIETISGSLHIDWSNGWMQLLIITLDVYRGGIFLVLFIGESRNMQEFMVAMIQSTRALVKSPPNEVTTFSASHLSRQPEIVTSLAASPEAVPSTTLLSGIQSNKSSTDVINKLTRVLPETKNEITALRAIRGSDFTTPTSETTSELSEDDPRFMDLQTYVKRRHQKGCTVAVLRQLIRSGEVKTHYRNTERVVLVDADKYFDGQKGSEQE